MSLRSVQFSLVLCVRSHSSPSRVFNVGLKPVFLISFKGLRDSDNNAILLISLLPEKISNFLTVDSLSVSL